MPSDANAENEHTTPDLKVFLNRLPAARDALNERLKLLRDQVIGVAKGYSTGLYLHGPAGHGKSHAIVSTLTERGVPFEHHQGHVTPVGLIETLSEHPDGIIVFDDVSEILDHRIALQALLAALGRPVGRKESDPDAHVRFIKYKRQGQEHVIRFTGGLIALSNLPLKLGGKLVMAVASRIDVIHYRLSDEEAAALMLDIGAQGYADHKGRTLTPEAATEVAHYVIHESLRAERPFDLRDLTHKGLPKRLQFEQGDAECDWKDLVRAALAERLVEPTKTVTPDSPRLLTRERLIEIAAEIAAGNGRGEKARVEEWTARTGKAGRSYYRWLDRAKRQK
jgi:hypothetical protein